MVITTQKDSTTKFLLQDSNSKGSCILEAAKGIESATKTIEETERSSKQFQSPKRFSHNKQLQDKNKEELKLACSPHNV